MDELVLSALRFTVPLICAALGGLLSERSGVANIALEGKLLFSAFAAAAVTAAVGSPEVGLVSGIVFGALIGFCFAFVSLKGRADQIVIGTAFNLLAVGSIPIFCRALYGVSGSTPSLSMEMRFTQPIYFVVLAILLVFVVRFLVNDTRFGIRLVAAGENPLALETQGVSSFKTRLVAVSLGGAIVGLGGAFLSLAQGSGYVRNMSAGRGFIALAALIFGGWRPIPTMIACLIFGFSEAMQIRLQGTDFLGFKIPNQFVQVLPFAVTLLVLLVVGQRVQAPRAINQDK